MKNSADRGGCYRPRWITPSEICRILHILRKPNTIILGFHSREKAEIKMKTFQYRQPRIWEMKEEKYTKSLAKNQVCAMVHMRDIRENVLPKFIKLCMETPCLCSLWPPKTNKNICFRVFLLMREFFAWGTHKDSSNIYSKTRDV